MTNMPANVLYPPLEAAIPNSQTTSSNEDSVMSEQLEANFGTLKKRKYSPEQGRQLALETAQLVDDEVGRMRNSIAELEALLHQGQPTAPRGPLEHAYHEYCGDFDDDEEDDGEDGDDEDESDDGGDLYYGERVGEGSSHLVVNHLRRPPRVVIIRDDDLVADRRDETHVMAE